MASRSSFGDRFNSSSFLSPLEVVSFYLILDSVYRSTTARFGPLVLLYSAMKQAAAAPILDLPRTGARQPWNKAPFRMFTQSPSFPM
jgi:hypothetical protein